MTKRLGSLLIVAGLCAGLSELRAASVSHSTSADFAGAGSSFTNLEDGGSGSSPQIRPVYDLPYDFGDGSDLAYTLSSSATDAPTDASVGGTNNAGSMVLNVSTTSGFAAGNVIFIHQSRGTNVGYWELNKIASLGANAFNLENALQYTYTDSGASQAQVIKVKQYSAVTINAGATLTAKAWNQNVGGIIVFMCSGTTNIAGSISAANCGYNGGSGCSGTLAQGEGTAGAGGSCSHAANGNGSGGGQSEGSNQLWTTSGGGGNGTAGHNGYPHNGGPACYGGTAAGSANLTNMVFGGGSGQYMTCAGVRGGGIVFIISRDLVVTGSISVRGQNGCGGNSGGSGGGASGSVLLKVKNPNVGANLVTAPATSGGPSGYGTPGGAGAIGRIHIDYGAAITGSTSPAADTAALTYKTAGTYLSPPMNIPAAAIMGDLVWTFSGGTSVQMRTRTASSSAGLSSATWSSPLTNAAGSAITSAAADWIQYEATFSGSASSPPVLTGVTVNYTTNFAPNVPTNLQVNGQANPAALSDRTPSFTAVYSDPEGQAASAYQVQVNTRDDFAGATIWDSGQVAIATASGYRCANITFGGSPLALDGSTYYWRIAFWDSGTGYRVSPWSTDSASFTMQNAGNFLPHTINYQGRLRQSDGSSVPDGSYPITFTLWDDAAASAPANNKWTETQASVQVAGGLFHTLLGSVNELSSNNFNAGEALWLGVKVGTDPELAPRQAIASVPFALRAESVAPSSIGSTELNVNAVTSTKLSTDAGSLGKVSGGLMTSTGTRIGINNASPTVTFQIGTQGDGTSALGNAWNTFSDARSKSNFQKVVSAMGKLQQISGYYYNWKDQPEARRQVGVLAQEVEQVLPEVVATDAQGYKSVDYSKLVPLLIEAVKEQQIQTTCEIQELRDELAKLKEQMNR